MDNADNVRHSEWKLSHPIVYPTVDCAIFKDRTLNEMYLAKKPNQDKWRFVGGFVDPSDKSFQRAALREAKEETGLDCTVLDWVTSSRIVDSRYAEKDDKIITSLFAMVEDSGTPMPMDDISELKLFKFVSIQPDMIVDEHRWIFLCLVGWMAKKPNAKGGND